MKLGEAVGFALGDADGFLVLGDAVGFTLGKFEGIFVVGEAVGLTLGCCDEGLKLGDFDGEAVLVGNAVLGNAVGFAARATESTKKYNKT